MEIVPLKHLTVEYVNGLQLIVPQLPAEVRDVDDTVGVRVRFAPTAPGFIQHSMTEFRYQFAHDYAPGDPVPPPCPHELYRQYALALAEFNAPPATPKPGVQQFVGGPLGSTPPPATPIVGPASRLPVGPDFAKNQSANAEQPRGSFGPVITNPDSIFNES